MSTLQLTPAQLAQAQTAQWKEILRQALADMRVAAPAIVQSFNANQTVNVQIAVSELVRTPDGPSWAQIAAINNVPIIVPRGGGFSLTLPLKPGDEGWLVFCDSCIDLWWLNGGVQPPPTWPKPAGASLIQPQFERRRHDVTDCGFFPGAWNQKRALPSYSLTTLQLRTDDGTCYIEITPGGVINIKAPGGLNINGTVIATGDVQGNGHSLSSHVHPGVQSGGSDTGTPIG